MNNELMHFGTKGMRWGFRHQPSRLGKAIKKFKRTRAREKKYYNEQSKINGTWQYHDKAANMLKKTGFIMGASSIAFATAAKKASEYGHPAEKWLSMFADATSIGAMINGVSYVANKAKAQSIMYDRIGKGKRVW